MKGRIAGKREVAKGTVEFTYDVVDEAFSFTPGQYFFIRIERLHYDDPRGNRRHFSIVNSPNQKNTIVMATRMRDSGFKRTLAELPAGAEVQLGPITGDFTLPAAEAPEVVFITGGIGITPFISMLRYAREQPLNRTITMLYANRDRESAAYVDELEAAAKAMPGFRLVLTMDRDPAWRGETRRIDADFVKDHVPDFASKSYMVAGPPGMGSSIATALAEAGVPNRNVIIESFSGY